MITFRKFITSWRVIGIAIVANGFTACGQVNKPATRDLDKVEVSKGQRGMYDAEMEDPSVGEGFTRVSVAIDKHKDKPLFQTPKQPVRMTAECYDPVHGNIPQFEIPSKYFGRILKECDGLVIDRKPDAYPWEYGTLHIWTSEREQKRICWYRNAYHYEGGGLSYNGIRVRQPDSDDWGGATVFDPMIRTIANELGIKTIRTQ